jgi:hypothetical protein
MRLLAFFLVSTFIQLLAAVACTTKQITTSRHLSFIYFFSFLRSPVQPSLVKSFIVEVSDQ